MGGSLHFIVIGTQKGATTTLWRHLAAHPELWLPPSKEAPFFSHDEVFDKGLDWYLGEFFTSAPCSTRWGTVTPHYMMGTADADVAEIARRIARTTPDARLIALLRDPIERAVSHFRMSVYREREARPCEEALRAALAPATLECARRAATETNSYVAQGEYGRILASYLQCFPRDRLHVAFTEDLARRPGATMREIFRFIGVDDRFVPPGGDVRVRRGGTRRRVDHEAERQLKLYLARAVWPEASRPREQRRAFDYFFNEWNVVPDDQSPVVGPELRGELRRHFVADARLLEGVTGLRPPWLEGSADHRLDV